MIASKLTNYKKLPFQFLRALLFLSLLSLIINADTTVVTAEDQPQHLIIVNEDSMDCDVEKDAKKLIVESLKCEDSNITILSQQKISEEYYVEYPTTMVDVFNDLTISVDVDFKDDLAINLYLLSIIQKSNPNATSISYKSLTNISYQVTYVLDYESPNYNQSIGKYLGAKYTKEDSKAQMSSASLYINGYRLPYLLEDGGEYYLPAYSLQDFRLLNIDTITDTNPKRSFYNIQWKSSKKTNKVIGKIEKTTTTYYEGDKDDYTLFRISNIDYIKVSDLLPKWRNKLTYSTKDNSFYYGTTPSSAESKLKTDVIYNYAVKITKGCTTNKEKVKALHDAIVLRCHYDLKNLSYYNSLEKKYYMTISQAMSLHMLNDKTGVCENYSRLFKECCDRLFIPCELITGSSGGEGHMWNRIYLSEKWYHIDLTYADYINNNYKKSADIRRTYYLKTANDLIGSRQWNGDDYNLPTFKKSWSEINRNNIQTTTQLRKAATYASYLCKNGKHKTYKFKIKGQSILTNCGYYILNYGYVNQVSGSYNNGILSLTFN